jgi:hypothetical protein
MRITDCNSCLRSGTSQKIIGGFMLKNICPYKATTMAKVNGVVMVIIQTTRDIVVPVADKRGPGNRCSCCR